MRKLQRHSSLIGTILSRLSNQDQTTEDLLSSKNILWETLGGDKLLISGEEAEERLTAEAKCLLGERTDKSELPKHLAERISHTLLAQMLETTEPRAGDKLTRFQVEAFFRHTTLKETVNEMADEGTQ